MKKATAYIDIKAIIELLKMPHKVELVSMEYPSKNGRVKITLQGDNLPVKASGPKAKVLPEVKYTIIRHWLNAKIEPRTKELTHEKSQGNASLSA